MVEIEVKPEWVGKNLIELNLRKKYGMNIVAMKKGGKVTVNVDPISRWMERPPSSSLPIRPS